jgi:hypothetical protein
MRVGFFLGLFLLASSAGLLSACASSQEPAPVDVTSDPSWIPPGQGDLAVGDDPEPKAKPKAKRPRHLEQPNKSDAPQGKVADIHAMTR